MYHPAPAVKRNYLCNVKTHRFFALAGLLQIPLCSADQPVLLGRIYGGSGPLQHPLAAGLYLADDDGAVRLPQHKIQLSHAGMIVMGQQLRALLLIPAGSGGFSTAAGLCAVHLLLSGQ